MLPLQMFLTFGVRMCYRTVTIILYTIKNNLSIHELKNKFKKEIIIWQKIKLIKNIYIRVD